MSWTEHPHPDADAAQAALAGALVDACRAAIAERGRAFLALAGGRTPLPAYRLAAAADLDWARVLAVPTDERCVPHDHPASNLRALQEAFGAAAPGWLALVPEDGDAARAAAHARAVLATQRQPFDAVVLGMGADAHVASLFPGADGLAEALDPAGDQDAARIDPQPPPPEAPFPRITLTAARLLRARSWQLLAIGDDKRRALQAADAARDPRRHPVAAFLHAPGIHLHVHWAP
ncbi:MAG: 6-phosphogluconolactonase [Gammaproteobacteria bacterium]